MNWEASSLLFILFMRANSVGSVLLYKPIEGVLGFVYFVLASPLYKIPVILPAVTPFKCILKSLKSKGTHPLFTRIPHSSPLSLR